MISARPSISNCSTPLLNLMGTVPSSPIIVGITVTFIFHSFLSCLAKSTYLPLCMIFTQWPDGMEKSTIGQILSLSLLFLVLITRISFLDLIMGSFCISDSLRILCIPKLLSFYTLRVTPISGSRWYYCYHYYCYLILGKYYIYIYIYIYIMAMFYEW